MDRSTSENGVEDARKLPATDDEFGGVVVEMKEPMDPDVFRSLLKTSMSQWKLQGKKGIWIKPPIDLSNLVDTAVKEGFKFHHAEPEYLMLLKWIPNTKNPIPANASHIARVGAIVLNDKREEKMGNLRRVWKISTGILHQVARMLLLGWLDKSKKRLE
ncbi:nudix hydrolase 10-like isoform X1 [Bidens hawaiensis]|uniref:nudix hydrolase 10-like isoform X1 n=1 Tax=Bidens hawaiensis TaxID=980011 RepID=UPI00404A8391